MNTRTLLTLIFAGMLLPLPAAADFAPTPILAQADTAKAKKAKSAKKKKDKLKGKKGKKGKKNKATTKDLEELFTSEALSDEAVKNMVKAAEGTKPTRALYDADILAKNAELASMMQAQGNTPMIDVHLERINNELRTKLARAYMEQRLKGISADSSLLAQRVAFMGTRSAMLDAEAISELLNSPKLTWKAPCSIHAMGAKGAALQVIYKMGETYIDALLLSDDIATIYGIRENISENSAPTLLPEYNNIPVK